MHAPNYIRAHVAGGPYTFIGQLVGEVFGPGQKATQKVELPANWDKLAALYQAGRLKLDELITSRYPLERINEAIESMIRGEALRNVIMF